MSLKHADTQSHFCHASSNPSPPLSRFSLSCETSINDVRKTIQKLILKSAFHLVAAIIENYYHHRGEEGFIGAYWGVEYVNFDQNAQEILFPDIS